MPADLIGRHFVLKLEPDETDEEYASGRGCWNGGLRLIRRVG